MAPKHPVPQGYGSPCDEGTIVTQGTGSGPVHFAYEEVDELTGKYNRHARGFEHLDSTTSNIFDDLDC